MNLPINSYEKAWLETRMVSLIAHLGIDQLRSTEIVLPSTKYNDRPVSLAGLEQIAIAFCEQLKMDPARITVTDWFNVPNHEYEPDPLVAFDEASGTIGISEILLGNEQDSVATLLSFISLIWTNDLPPGTFQLQDQLWLSDLIPVYLGWGIFGANTTVYDWSSSEGDRSFFQIMSRRYLPSRMFGYALALFAWARNENNPDWAKNLRPDASKPFKILSEHLRKTDDCYFSPERLGTADPLDPKSFDTDRCRELLSSQSASTCLAAMMRLQKRPDLLSRFADELIALLKREDNDLRRYALECLMFEDQRVHAAEAEIAKLVTVPYDMVRAAAITLLGFLQPRNAPDNHQLIRLINDNADPVAMASVAAIRHFVPNDSHDGKVLTQTLLKSFKRRIVDCKIEMAMMIGQAILEVVEQPHEQIRKFFEDDPELREQALEMLEPGEGIIFFDD